jgi:hypothetical protein
MFTEACESLIALEPTDLLILRVMVAAIDAVSDAVDNAGPGPQENALHERRMETASCKRASSRRAIAANWAGPQRHESGMESSAPNEAHVGSDQDRDFVMHALASSPEEACCAQEQPGGPCVHDKAALVCTTEDLSGVGPINQVRDKKQEGVSEGDAFWWLGRLAKVMHQAQEVLSKSGWGRESSLFFLV